MTSNKEDSEMICGLTVDERRQLQQGLDALPDTMPPREVWDRIRAQGVAEGLIGAQKSSPNRWYFGLGIAAAVAMTALLLPGWREMQTEPAITVPPQADSVTAEPNALGMLMVESRQLESELRSLPEQPRVIRAGTQAMILDLEDRIAAIDYQLNDPDFQPTAEEEEIFWRERVRLMKSLVQLRYAQAQRTNY